MPQVMKPVVLVLAVVTAGAVALYARGQTQRPGDMTQARVWVENRGRGQAVPVVVENLPASVRVDDSPPIHVVTGRQQWDYRSVQLQAAANADVFNNPLGTEGWEAVGVIQASASGATILFKRPR